MKREGNPSGRDLRMPDSEKRLLEVATTAFGVSAPLFDEFARELDDALNPVFDTFAGGKTSWEQLAEGHS